MKTSNTKETKKGANELTEAFALWLHKSKANNEYLSGLTDKDDIRLVGYFNTNKKNPKEPDIRVYSLNDEGKQDLEVADLWENVSKQDTRYLSGSTNDKEKLVGFYGDKKEEKRPYIRVYYN